MILAQKGCPQSRNLAKIASDLLDDIVPEDHPPEDADSVEHFIGYVLPEITCREENDTLVIIAIMAEPDIDFVIEVAEYAAKAEANLLCFVGNCWVTAPPGYEDILVGFPTVERAVEYCRVHLFG